MIPLQPIHAALAAELHRRVFSDESWNGDAMAALLAMPGAFGWLAGEQSPGGFILCRQAADEAEIITIAVLPDRRRHGLGGRLLDATLATALQAGAGRLLLEVDEDNAAALALYAGRGFHAVGRRPNYYGPGRHATILAADLTTD